MRVRKFPTLCPESNKLIVGAVCHAPGLRNRTDTSPHRRPSQAMPSEDNYKKMYDAEKKRRLAAERHVKVLLDQLEDLGIEPKFPETPESPAPAATPTAPAPAPAPPVPEPVPVPVPTPPAPAPAPAPAASPGGADAGQIRQDLRMAVMEADVAKLEAAIKAATEAGMDHEAGIGRRKLAALQ